MSRVICIAGKLAAGKTTLLRALGKELSASALLFDEYQDSCRWPSDLHAWLAAGADPGDVTNPRLRDDLASLAAGRPATHPSTGIALPPTEVILLEDPFGRTRPDIADLIDLVLFVDLPDDLCVVRLMQRALELESSPSDPEAVHALPREDVDRRLISARRWILSYVQLREMYTTLTAPVRDNSDVVLDGRLPRAALVQAALEAIPQT